jgi:MscS family membrane protein
MRFLGILAFFLLTICSHGQIPGLSLPAAGSAAQAAAETDDPFGRSTPRGTVLGLINAIQREDLPRATKYLDTNLPQAKAETLAEQLKTVLDRRLFLALNDISDQPGGDETDDDDPAVERLGSVEGPAGQVAILLHRVKRDNKQVWLFSPATLHKIPNVYSDIDANWIEQNLPEGLRRTKIAGIPLWRMLTFFINLAGALLTASFASKLSYVVLDRVAERFAPSGLRGHVFEFGGPIRVLFTAASFLVLAWLSSTLVSRNFWFTTAGVIGTVGFTWLGTRIVDGLFEIIERRRLAAQSGGDMALRRLLKRAAKLLVIFIGFVALLQVFGKDPTTLIAGLGVGGIAIAFAAQKTLENLFGGVMIISDHPIRVGDFCRIGTVDGTVEDIGLRSTRIRTLQRTVVSIPNGVLATQNIENFGVRDKFWLRHVLGLRYETTPEQMRAVLANIQQLLLAHPQIEQESCRVRFIAYNASSMDVEVFAYVLAPDWPSHLAIQEQLLLRLAEIVQECGTGFAFPSQTMYLAKDSLAAISPETPPPADPAGQEQET